MISIAVASVSLFLAHSAAAAPPVLTAVTIPADRHPSAVFSSPKADSETIYFATAPDQATDGSFFQENVKDIDILTTDEIQRGSWTSEDQLDPGAYFVMLRASPSFDACFDLNSGAFDPSCASGYSNVVKVVVPLPRIRYSLTNSAPASSSSASVEVKALPLGTKQPFRLCVRDKVGHNRCVSSTLAGYSWNSAASDSVSFSKHRLPKHSVFTLSVAGENRQQERSHRHRIARVAWADR